MKKTTYYYLSLVAIMAGTLVSCQDENQGVDFEIVKRSKYERDFKSVFGEVAPNHAFNFDHANLAMGLSSSSSRSSATRADNPYTPIESGNVDNLVWKQNATRTYNGYGNIKAEELFGMPKDITQHEHDEVFAWFTNHKVDWAVTPTNLDQVGSSRICKDENGQVITDTEGNYLVIAHTILASNPNYGSLKDYPSNPLVGDYTSQDPLFYNGWIQNVAWDMTDEYAIDGANKYNGQNMNYLAFASMDNPDLWVHLLDYNGNGTGYGWNSQNTGGQKFNAELVMDSKFNNVVYKCSADGGHFHDKYLLVYLKGDDYEGWYLGLDFEAYEVGCSIDHNASMVVNADGICNDWILKIGDAGATPFNPARIMCEDLGTNDFDFNDIVYDVKIVDNNCVIVTVQAVGGTIPIQLRYDAKPNGSSNTYQVFTKNQKTEMHDIFGADVTQPVKVNAPGGLDNPNPYTITWYLKFKTSDTSGNYWDGSVNHPIDYFFSGDMDLQALNVYVQHENMAEWINLNNRDGNVPLKFCVPFRRDDNTEVKWTKENQRITKAYNKFDEWLLNTRVLFWNTVSDASVLFNN